MLNSRVRTPAYPTGVKNRRLAGKQCLAQQTSGARLITYPTHPQQQSYSRYCDTIGAWASAVSTASVPGIDGAEHIHKTSKSVGPRWSRRIERVQQDPAGETKRDDVRLEASSLPLFRSARLPRTPDNQLRGLTQKRTTLA